MIRVIAKWQRVERELRNMFGSWGFAEKLHHLLLQFVIGVEGTLLVKVKVE